MSDELQDEIESLRRLSRKQLQDRWQTLFRAAPPVGYTPDLLARGIAWRLQEIAHGGLSADARRLLRSGHDQHRSTSLRPGNRLVRRWRGHTHVVEAVDGGFTYDGAQYGSLSEVATLITGTRWSGPRFFGLAK